MSSALVREQLVSARAGGRQTFGDATDPQSPEFTEAARSWMAEWVYSDPPLLQFAHERWVLHEALAARLMAQSAAENDHPAAVGWALEAGGSSDAPEALRSCVDAILQADIP